MHCVRAVVKDLSKVAERAYLEAFKCIYVFRVSYLLGALSPQSSIGHKRVGGDINVKNKIVEVHSIFIFDSLGGIKMPRTILHFD